jgi:hypothetical protein
MSIGIRLAWLWTTKTIYVLLSEAVLQLNRDPVGGTNELEASVL